MMDGFYFHHHLQPFSHPLIAEDKIIKGKCYVASKRMQSKQLHTSCFCLPFSNPYRVIDGVLGRLATCKQANSSYKLDKWGKCGKHFFPHKTIIIS